MTTKLGVLLGLLALPLVAHGASFDCGKASTRVENLVCSDDELSKQDELVAKAYERARAAPGLSGQITRTQRAWLARRNACRDRACIRAAYASRLKELQNISQTGAKDDCDSGGTSEMYSCFSERLQDSEDQLTNLYNKMLTSIESRYRDRLEKSQDTWLEYRNAQCAFRFAADDPRREIPCRLQMNEQRKAFLLEEMNQDCNGCISFTAPSQKGRQR